jgi:hypothetical protein
VTNLYAGTSKDSGGLLAIRHVTYCDTHIGMLNLQD